MSQDSDERASERFFAVKPLAYPQFAYTGPNPEKGYVGFVNIQETDAGVKFTVRSQGENPTLAEFEMDIGNAIELLDKALTNFCERE